MSSSRTLTAPQPPRNPASLKAGSIRALKRSDRSGSRKDLKAALSVQPVPSEPTSHSMRRSLSTERVQEERKALQSARRQESLSVDSCSSTQEVKKSEVVPNPPVPRNLSITKQQMRERRYLNEERWFCVPRPQYLRNCGIASLTSAFNYLFSTLGEGCLPPVSQEQAMSVLGFKPPFDDIKFGAFAGNQRLLQWFRSLMKHFNVQGECGFYFKPVGRGSKNARYTTGDQALSALKQDLRRTNVALVYHCFNHYFSPVGYETSPVEPHEAYSATLSGSSVTALLVGDSSKKFMSLQAIPWEDVVKDLTLKKPRFYDVRRPHEGVQTKQIPKGGKACSGGPETNCHCLMYFEKTL